MEIRDPIVVIGGTGFVGQALAEGWTHPVRPLRYLVHRSVPVWLKGPSIDIRQVDLSDEASIGACVEGTRTAINLLRPLGDGWYPTVLRTLAPGLRRAGIVRCVHTSSIDVFNGTDRSAVDEDTPPAPRTPYEREHIEAETIILDTFAEPAILRLGAVFGVGGRNVVGFADELARGGIKPVLRRVLNGARRMHLVSAETVRQALEFMAIYEGRPSSALLLVTDDGFEENNFAYVQDTLAEALGRRPLTAVPSLPRVLLEATLALRGKTRGLASRRFASKRLQELGFRNADFPSELRAYARTLAQAANVPS